MRFFSRVDSQMSPQINCLNRREVTLIAFVRLFSGVSFHMHPQTAYFNRCIVALQTFVRFFSSVYFQVCYQASFIFGFKVTLLTLKIPLHVFLSNVLMPRRKRCSLWCRIIYCILCFQMILKTFTFPNPSFQYTQFVPRPGPSLPRRF